MASYFNKHNEGPEPSTTFVQADPSNFRSIVQKLTGPTTFKLPISNPSRHAKKVGHDQLSVHKLHERRKTGKKLQITLNSIARDGEMVMSSPVSTLDGRESPMENEEEKAIAEKGFYLHPSPSRGSDQPQLLLLFPLNSPN